LASISATISSPLEQMYTPIATASSPPSAASDIANFQSDQIVGPLGKMNGEKMKPAATYRHQQLKHLERVEKQTDSAKWKHGNSPPRPA
jgi:hypothetical protein